jgi:hypothetical protein
MYEMKTHDEARTFTMTDREKLLIALLSNEDERGDGAVTGFEVATMLYELGEEFRHRPHPRLLLASA